MEIVQFITEVAKEWGGIFSVATLAPILVVYFLNRKSANKKLQLDEEAGDISVFNAQVEGFEKILKAATDAADRADKGLKAAMKELDNLSAERRQLYVAVEEQNMKIEKLRNLFRSIVEREGIQMTDEEWNVFEQTKPRKLWDKE